MTKEHDLLSRMSWLFALPTGLLVAFATHGNEQEPLEYVVRCDKARQELTVAPAQPGRSSESASSTGNMWQRTVRPDTLTKIGGTDNQPLRLSAGSRTFQCRLGDTRYRVVVKPFIFNARIMGMCGAGEPDISLTIERNGQALVSELDFASCEPARAVQRVQASEARRSISVSVILDLNFLPVKVDRTFPYASLPSDWYSELFDKFPTGDSNADLFIAVSKRDLALIEEQLRKGANPNVVDLRSFPPLAYLRRGRETAYRAKTLSDFDRQSTEIAALLIGHGATGHAINGSGVTLLDYLIGAVPPTVIELLLKNGANVHQGHPLRNAATYGDWRLLERLLGEGADPHRKNPDRTTALWSASSSGFYSYSASGWDPPPIEDYAKCIRLLVASGAKVDEAMPDREGLLWFLVRSFGKDERLKVILAELIPHSSNELLAQARSLADKLAVSNDAYSPIARWLKERAR
jgi:hypothetical protein